MTYVTATCGTREAGTKGLEQDVGHGHAQVDTRAVPVGGPEPLTRGRSAVLRDRGVAQARTAGPVLVGVDLVQRRALTVDRRDAHHDRVARVTVTRRQEPLVAVVDRHTRVVVRERDVHTRDVPDGEDLRGLDAVVGGRQTRGLDDALGGPIAALFEHDELHALHVDVVDATAVPAELHRPAVGRGGTAAAVDRDVVVVAVAVVVRFVRTTRGTLDASRLVVAVAVVVVVRVAEVERTVDALVDQAVAVVVDAVAVLGGTRVDVLEVVVAVTVVVDLTVVTLAEANVRDVVGTEAVAIVVRGAVVDADATAGVEVVLEPVVVVVDAVVALARAVLGVDGRRLAPVVVGRVVAVVVDEVPADLRPTRIDQETTVAVVAVTVPVDGHGAHGTAVADRRARRRSATPAVHIVVHEAVDQGGTVVGRQGLHLRAEGLVHRAGERGGEHGRDETELETLAPEGNQSRLGGGLEVGVSHSGHSL